jgi:hypothetical protein
MSVNLESKSTKELETIVANCERLNRTANPIFAAAQLQLEHRRTGEYDMDKTIATIRGHGQAGKFVCYKDIAEASGLNWVSSRRRIAPHLDAVCADTESKGWPLLTSIVVNMNKLETGEMTADNLKGFLDAARAAGRTVDIDEAAFVKREQKRVFTWCKQER